MAEISTKPYLIRAIYEWCTDSGYRPHIAVVVDEHTVVPREFVRSGEIVLNVSAHATNRLNITNEVIEFEARFGGVARSVSIPIDNVSAIYAQENGHGMAFEVPTALALVPEPGNSDEIASSGDVAAFERHIDERSEIGQDDGEDETGEPGPASAPGARRPKLAAVPSAPSNAKAPKRRRKEKGAASSDSTILSADTSAERGEAAAPVVTPANPAGAAPSTPGRSPAGVSSSSDDDPPKPPSGRPRLTRIK